MNFAGDDVLARNPPLMAQLCGRHDFLDHTSSAYSVEKIDFREATDVVDGGEGEDLTTLESTRLMTLNGGNGVAVKLDWRAHDIKMGQPPKASL